MFTFYRMQISSLMVISNQLVMVFVTPLFVVTFPQEFFIQGPLSLGIIDKEKPYRSELVCNPNFDKFRFNDTHVRELTVENENGKISVSLTDANCIVLVLIVK